MQNPAVLFNAQVIRNSHYDLCIGYGLLWIQIQREAQHTGQNKTSAVSLGPCNKISRETPHRLPQTCADACLGYHTSRPLARRAKSWFSKIMCIYAVHSYKLQVF